MNNKLGPCRGFNCDREAIHKCWCDFNYCEEHKTSNHDHYEWRRHTMEIYQSEQS